MKKLIKRWGDMPDSVKSTIAFVVSSFILKGVSFITTPIFTRIMNVSQYGTLSTYNSWLVIIEVIALLGLTSAGVFNVGLNDYRDSRDEYMSSVLGLCNVVTIVVFGLIAVGKKVFGQSFLIPTNQLLLMFLWLIFTPAQIFWITRKRYEYKYKLASWITILSTVISQIVAIFAIKIFSGENTAEIKLWSQSITTILFALPIYLFIFIKGKSCCRFFYWKQVLIFSLPLIPHYLSQHIMSSADRIMIADMISSADAGIYSVVNNIPLIASIIWSAINASLIAFTFENLNKKEYSGINRIVTLLLVGYAIACAAVALVAPEVIKLLAPENYYKGIYAVPPLICVAFLSAEYNIYANIEFYYKKTAYIALSTVIATVVNIILNLILISKFSFVGAAYATLISYIVLILMHYCGYKRCQKEQVYNNKIIVLITVVCIIVCLLCNLVYFSFAIRYIIIGGIFVIFVWRRKDVVKVINFFRK